MGAIFKLEHINFVSYLTAKAQPESVKRPAPRSDIDTLRTFLEMFAHDEIRNNNLISNSGKWQDDLRDAASVALNQLPRQSDQTLSSEDVANALDPLCSFFLGYKLYVLIVPPFKIIETKQAIEERQSVFAAIGKDPDVLVLMPQEGGNFVNIIDPFPALKTLAWSPVAPPAAVYWTKTGTTLALNLKDAVQFYRVELADYLSGMQVSKLDGLLNQKAAQRKIRRILHISDVHFGNPEADLRLSSLQQHLAGIIPQVDRVILSGDLFHSPSGKLRRRFNEFKTGLENWTRQPIIVVPGNHDVRWWGNAIGRWMRSRKYFYDLGFQPLIIDRESELLFLCFDSCEMGDWARGGVSLEQRLQLGTQLDQALRKDPALAKYGKVAIVHHHPYDYETPPTALYEKLMEKVFGRSIDFLAFENADEFINWCGVRKIPIVLHGHKHIPHIVLASVDLRNQTQDLIIVGCGSSTGIEEKPMCYDVVALDQDSKQWAVSFFHDPDRDGSGFTIQNVALDFRTKLPS